MSRSADWLFPIFHSVSDCFVKFNYVFELSFISFYRFRIPQKTNWTRCSNTVSTHHCKWSFHMTSLHCYLERSWGWNLLLGTDPCWALYIHSWLLHKWCAWDPRQSWQDQNLFPFLGWGPCLPAELSVPGSGSWLAEANQDWVLGRKIVATGLGYCLGPSNLCLGTPRYLCWWCWRFPQWL